MDARSTGILSLVEKRVLQLAADEYESHCVRRRSGDDRDPDQERRIRKLLDQHDIGLLIKEIGELELSLRLQLKHVFNRLEESIVVEGSVHFRSEERRDAYAFLISISDLTIPE